MIKLFGLDRKSQIKNNIMFVYYLLKSNNKKHKNVNEMAQKAKKIQYVILLNIIEFQKRYLTFN